MPRKAKEKEIENTNTEEVVISPKKSKSTASSPKKKSTSTKKDIKTKEVKKASNSSDATTTKTIPAKSRNTKSDKLVETTAKEPASKKTAKNVEKNIKVTEKSTAKASKVKPSETSNETSKAKKTKNNSTKTSSSKTKKAASSTKTSSSKTKKAASSTKTSNSRTKKATGSTKTKAKKSKTNSAEIEILEYYDLPYKYGNTLVKLLAQTPKTLFVYWEISDIDIAGYKEKYGDNFFFITKPILIVHNLTLDETYEVEINDFANCWYLNIEHADCKYDIELARKFIQSPITKAAKKNEYLFISKSNDLIAPNDHILFEKLANFITFKNVSTGENIKKNIKSFKFLTDLYEFYKNMYKDEILNNPSSNFNIQF